MSRIEKLIKEKCPDGVVYKSVGEVCDTCTDYTAAGSFADIAKNVQYKDVPDYALLVRTMDVKSKFTRGNLVYIDEHAYDYLWRVQLDEPCIIMPNIGNCGEVYYVISSDLPYDKCALAPNAILLRSSSENLKYISYIFQTPEFQKQLKKITSPVGQTKFNKTEMKKLEIPVPPIEVQQEIVCILDKFAALEAELQAELDARKKQYEYCRDALFTFEKNVVYKNILDVITMKARVGWQALTKKEYLQEGEYYLITGTDFLEDGSIEFDSCVFVSEERYDMDENIKVHAKDILMTKDGTLGKVAFLENEPPKPATLNGGVYRLTVISDEVLPRYMYHYFTSQEFKCFVEKVKTGGTIKHLTQKWFETLEIPIPSIEVQKTIIKSLDLFNDLCCKKNIGLVAEIEARHKQYEYYRDKLLTFERKVV